MKDFRIFEESTTATSEASAVEKEEGGFFTADTVGTTSSKVSSKCSWIVNKEGFSEVFGKPRFSGFGDFGEIGGWIEVGDRQLEELAKLLKLAPKKVDWRSQKEEDADKGVGVELVLGGSGGGVWVGVKGVIEDEEFTGSEETMVPDLTSRSVELVVALKLLSLMLFIFAKKVKFFYLICNKKIQKWFFAKKLMK